MSAKNQIEIIKTEIAISLGYDPSRPPNQIDDHQAALALGVKVGTLSVWRSTGRYGLPFSKIGRLVRYRLADVAKFIDSRTSIHTG